MFFIRRAKLPAAMIVALIVLTIGLALTVGAYAQTAAPMTPEQAAAAKAAARAKRLDQLATRTEAAWEKVAEWIETRRPSDYDLAVSQLQDLQALAERDGNSDAFGQRFGELRARHIRKPSLQDRFDRAGLPRR